MLASGWLPAALCCLAAYTDEVSIAGAVYLCVFLLWGHCAGFMLPSAGGPAWDPDAALINPGQLWAGTSSFSVVLWLGRIAAQTVYALNLLNFETNTWHATIVVVLRTIGLGAPATSLPHALGLLAPPLAAAVAAYFASQACWDALEGGGDTPLSLTPSWSYARRAASAAAASLGQPATPVGARGGRPLQAARAIRGTGSLGDLAGATPNGDADTLASHASAAPQASAAASSTPPPATGGTGMFWRTPRHGNGAGGQHLRTTSSVSFTGADEDDWQLVLQPLLTSAHSPTPGIGGAGAGVAGVASSSRILPAMTESASGEINRRSPPPTGAMDTPSAAAAVGTDRATVDDDTLATLAAAARSLATALLFLCAILWPGSVSLPYVIASACWHVCMSCTSPECSPVLQAVHVFAGAHAAMLYYCQQSLVGPGPPQQWSGLLGLYSLSSDLTPLGSKLLQAAHLTAVHALYAVTAAAAASPPPPPGWAPRLRPALGVAVGRVVGAAAGLQYVLQSTLVGPLLLAVVLCGFSLLNPSIVASVTLLLSMVTLLAPGWSSRAWGAWPGYLARLFLAALLLSLYASCSLRLLLTGLPQGWTGVGLVLLSDPPLCAATLGSLLLAVMLSGSVASSSVQVSMAGGVAGRGPREALPPAGLAQWWAAHRLSVMVPAWAAGCVAVPVAWLLLGAATPDALHSLYGVCYVLLFTTLTARPQPTAVLAASCRRLHVVRVFAALHLLVLHVLVALGAPGLGLLDWVPEDGFLQAVLRLLGLWQPSVPRVCLPLFGALLLSCLHVHTSRWVRTRQVTFSAAQGGGRAPPAWFAAASRAAAGITRSVGHIGLGLVVAVLVCRGPGQTYGVIGLGHLLLAALVLSRPPWDKHEANSAVDCSGHSAVGQRLTYGEAEEEEASGAQGEGALDLHTPLLRPSAPPAHAARRGCVQPGWCLLSAMSLLAALGLTARLMVVQLVGMGLLSQRVQAVLQDVFGIRCLPPGAHLLSDCLPPATILLGVRLYKWWAALDVRGGEEAVSVRPSLGAGSPAAGHAASLKGQMSSQWLAKRFTILHVNHALGLLLLGLCVKAPGVLGLVAVAGLVGAALATTYVSVQRWRRGADGATALATSWSGRLRVATVTYVAAWLLTQYVVLVPAVSESAFGDGSGKAARKLLGALDWLGIVVPLPAAAPLQALAVARTALQLCCGVLGCLSLHARAQAWLLALPPAVVAAAQPGEPCRLFWPPTGRFVRVIAPGGAGGDMLAPASALPVSYPPRASSFRFPLPASTFASAPSPGLSGSLLLEEQEAQAQLLQAMDQRARHMEEAVGAVFQPLRVLATAAISGAAAGTQTLMQVMEIPVASLLGREDSTGSGSSSGGSGGSAIAPHRRGLGRRLPARRSLSEAADVAAEVQGRGAQLSTEAAEEPTVRQAGAGEVLPAGSLRLSSPSHISQQAATIASFSVSGGSSPPGASAPPSPQAVSPASFPVPIAAASAGDPLPASPPATPSPALLPPGAEITGGQVAGAGDTSVHNNPFAAPAAQEAAAALTLDTAPRAGPLLGAASTPLPHPSPIALLLLSVRDQLDGWGVTWGLHVHLAALLLTAFSLGNVLALPCILGVVYGTASPYSAARARVWRVVLLPTLAILLVYQYASWVGYDCLALRPARTHDMLGLPAGDLGVWLAWLGMTPPANNALWLLLFSLGTACLQVCRDAGTLAPMLPPTTQPSAGTPLLIDIEAPPTHVQPAHAAPPLPASALAPAPSDEVTQSIPGIPGPPPPLGDYGLIKPLLFSERHTWGWLEWSLFYTLKHSFDALLVCVVLACTYQRDLVHAGYLALALLLFRTRAQLQRAASQPSQSTAEHPSGRAPHAALLPLAAPELGGLLPGTSFWLLPAFNLLVLVLQVMYQAPLFTFLGRNWNNACHAVSWGPSLADGGFWLGAGLPPRGVPHWLLGTPDPETGCTLPQLLGFCKLKSPAGQPPATPLSVLLTTEAVADVVLWVLLRLHAKLLASVVYKQVMVCVVQQQALQRVIIQQRIRDGVEAQARAALLAGQLAASRAQRVAKLKRLFCDPTDGPDVDGPALFERMGNVAGLAEMLDSDLPLDAAILRLRGGSAVAAPPASRNPSALSLARPRVGDAGAGRAEQGRGEAGRAPPLGLPPRASRVVHDASGGAGAPLTPMQPRRSGWASQLLALLQGQRLRRRAQMWIVCTMWLLLLLSHVSILALLPCLSLVAYTLLSPSRHAPTAYWQAALVYAEALLVMQYIYLSITNCLCSPASNTAGASPGTMLCSGWLYHPTLQRAVAVVGLQPAARACLPMFLAYLATLMYNYQLANIQKQGTGRAGGFAGQGFRPLTPRNVLRAPLRAATSCAVKTWMTVASTFRALGRAWWLAGQPHEAGRHWLQLQLVWPSPGAANIATSSPAGRQLLAAQLTQLVMQGQAGLGNGSPTAPQSGMHVARLGPPSGGLNNSIVRRRSADGNEDAGLSAGPGPSAASGPSALQAGPPSRSLLNTKRGGGSMVQRRGSGRASSGDAVPIALRLEHCSLRPDGCTAVVLLEVLPPEDAAARGYGEMDAVWTVQPPRPATTARAAMQAISDQQTRLEQQLQAALPWMPRAGSGLAGGREASGATILAAGSGPPGHGPRFGALLAQLHASTGTEGSDPVSNESIGPAAALLPMPPPQAPPGAAPTSAPTTAALPPAVPPLPIAAALPNRASAPIVGLGDALGAAPLGRAETAVRDLPFRVRNPQAHSRTPLDLYAWTITVDALAFLYAALVYQAVVYSGATRMGGLVDLGDDTRTLPLGYLAALLALFTLIVADRTVYTIGSTSGKLVLHLITLVLLLPWCFTHYWRLPATSPGRTHIRTFLLLRSLSWALGAQQLMWGYPPLAGMGPNLGRHANLFYRKPDSWHFMAFNVYSAVPFLYELRTLLDWTCTPTTLDLYSWLKLEDIRSSLYIASARRHMAAGRALGDRVPRYAKLLQGLLTLCLLLLVLWLPPFLFSQGAPTYTIPGLTGASVNLTITSAPAGSSSATQASFPLYAGGYSFSFQEWGMQRPDGQPPTLPSLLLEYDHTQVQLMCLAPASQAAWALTPPAQDALVALLNSSAMQLSLSWAITRSAPLSNGRGAGPGCSAIFATSLSGRSRQQLLEVVQGLRDEAVLERLNVTDPNGSAPSAPGLPGLYPLMWQARGESCVLRIGLDSTTAGTGAAAISGANSSARSKAAAVRSPLRDDGWKPITPGLSSKPSPPAPSPPAPSGPDQPPPPPETYTKMMVSCRLALRRLAGLAWWELGCSPVDGDGLPLANTTLPEQVGCPDSAQGAQAVVLLERVQSGLLGATISSFGLTGLYVTFVYGIARLLRLSIGNLRLKIPSEDLPSCRRLVALCQDIYMARAQGELVLEEQLFRAVINIYRSPAVLFELTRKHKLA